MSRDVVLKVAIAVKVDVTEREGLSTDMRKNLSSLILTRKDLATMPDDPQLLLFRALQMAGASGRPGDVAVTGPLFGAQNQALSGRSQWLSLQYAF